MLGPCGGLKTVKCLPQSQASEHSVSRLVVLFGGGGVRWYSLVAGDLSLGAGVEMNIFTVF